METLFSKIQNRKAAVAVIGLGHVGLPLAAEIAQAGFQTFGLDLSREKADRLNEGVCPLPEPENGSFRRLVQEGRFRATHRFEILKDCEVFCLCIPTPWGEDQKPDLSSLIRAVRSVRDFVKPDRLILLESTVYPGVTEEVVAPLLEETGLKADRDFYLAHSPERVDPGNSRHRLKNIPKIVGGLTFRGTEAALAFYRSFLDQVIPVSSSRTAETVKLFENTFRFVNIALVNELAQNARRMGVNPWEVLEAAATKPFGFMPFHPGPGVGGPCLPASAQYLKWAVERTGGRSSLIESAEAINASMPFFVVEKISAGLQKVGKSLSKARILILGVAYKENIQEARETPAVRILGQLRKEGAQIAYYDPHIPRLRVEEEELLSLSPSLPYGAFDGTVLLVPHAAFDLERIVKESKILVDVRNATQRIRGYKNKVIKF